MRYVAISIGSHAAAEHDGFRAQPGAWDRLTAAEPEPVELETAERVREQAPVG